MNDIPADSAIVEVASVTNDLSDIQHFRYRIYVEEMKLSLPGADHVRKTLSDPLDETGIHIVARLRSKLVGAVRLNPDTVPQGMEEVLQARSLPRPYVYCSRLCVADTERGRGVMSKLVTASFNKFAELRAAAAVCHCFADLCKLYERLGFESYGAPFLTPGLQHLGAQTPYLRLLAQRQPSRAA